MVTRDAPAGGASSPSWPRPPVRLRRNVYDDWLSRDEVASLDGSESAWTSVAAAASLRRSRAQQEWCHAHGVPPRDRAALFPFTHPTWRQSRAADDNDRTAPFHPTTEAS